MYETIKLLIDNPCTAAFLMLIAGFSMAFALSGLAELRGQKEKDGE